MKTIGEGEDIICVPEGWSDISLGDYETWFYKTKPKTPYEKIELIAEICKIDPSILFNSPVGLTNIILDTVNFIFTETDIPSNPFIEIEGVKYVVPITEELTTASWIDVEEAQKGTESVLSTILAITCLPVGETYDPRKTEERQQMFAALKVNEVLPVLGFFLHYKKILERRSAMFLGIQEAANLYLNNTESFPNGGDGTKSLPIWRRVQYCVLTKWWRYRLRKCLRS